MGIASVKLFVASKKATLDSAIAAYKAGVGTELLTSQRGMAADMVMVAGAPRLFAALAHDGLDVPVTKTADLQHVTVQADGPASALQAAIDYDLAHVVHATDTSGDTTVAGQVEVGDPLFFDAAEDVGRIMNVAGVEKVITAITDDAVAATGSLLAVAKAAPLADNDNFTLDDGVNPATVFEFQVTGGFVPTPGRVAIDIQLLTLAPEIADAMRAAIVGVGAGLLITPDATGLALINLTNDVAGAAGNVAITESIAAGPGVTLTPVGMAGGADATASIAHYAGAALASGIGKTVKLLGAEVIQELELSTTIDRDGDSNMLLLVACEGQVA